MWGLGGAGATPRAVRHGGGPGKGRRRVEDAVGAALGDVGKGLGQLARGQFARSFFEGFFEDLFLLFIRSAVPRERSFNSFFFILDARDIRLCYSI